MPTLPFKLDSDGWTQFPVASDAVVLYVSAGGNDLHPGTSPETPLRTIAKAFTFLKEGKQLVVKLRRGEVFHEPIPPFKASGLEAFPHLVTSYGAIADNRPQIRVFSTNGTNQSGRDNLAFVDLHFKADGRDPGEGVVDQKAAKMAGTGIRMFNAQNVYIEGCRLDYFQSNITIESINKKKTGPVFIRRNALAYAYSIENGHSQGLYLGDIDGCLLEENTFHHNGWLNEAGGLETVYNHNVYYQVNGSDFVCRGNISSEGSGHGIQARAGGLVERNLFLNESIGLAFGLINGSATPTMKEGGVCGEVRDNAFIGSKWMGKEKRGVGMQIGNLKKGGNSKICRNLFARESQGYFPAIILNCCLDPQSRPASRTVGIRDTEIFDNVVRDWSKGAIMSAVQMRAGAEGPTGISGVKVYRNDFDKATLFTPIVYGGVLEPATRNHKDTTIKLPADFIVRALDNRKGNWDPAYTAEGMLKHLATGFDVGWTFPEPLMTKPTLTGLKVVNHVTGEVACPQFSGGTFDLDLGKHPTIYVEAVGAEKATGVTIKVNDVSLREAAFPWTYGLHFTPPGWQPSEGKYTIEAVTDGGSAVKGTIVAAKAVVVPPPTIPPVVSPPVVVPPTVPPTQTGQVNPQIVAEIQAGFAAISEQLAKMSKLFEQLKT